jgi:hypothetical protein
MQIEGGWACLLPWTICIIVGKSVLLLGKVLTNKDGNKFIILEGIANQGLWI